MIFEDSKGFQIAPYLSAENTWKSLATLIARSPWISQGSIMCQMESSLSTMGGVWNMMEKYHLVSDSLEIEIR